MSNMMQYQCLYAYNDLPSLISSIRGVMDVLGSFPDNSKVDITMLPYQEKQDDSLVNLGYLGVVFKSANGAIGNLKPHQVISMSGKCPNVPFTDEQFLIVGA